MEIELQEAGKTQGGPTFIGLTCGPKTPTPREEPLLELPEARRDLSTCVVGRSRHRHFARKVLAISIFYFAPSVQILWMLVTLQDDDGLHELAAGRQNKFTCHYNLKCKHNLGPIPAFNNVLSNIAYPIAAAAAWFYIHKTHEPSLPGRGVYFDIGLYEGVLTALSCIGLFSGLYHTCPCSVSFQFDTTMMYFFGALMILVLRYKRRTNVMKSCKPTQFLIVMAYFFLLSTFDTIFPAMRSCDTNSDLCDDDWWTRNAETVLRAVNTVVVLAIHGVVIYNDLFWLPRQEAGQNREVVFVEAASPGGREHQLRAEGCEEFRVSEHHVRRMAYFHGTLLTMNLCQLLYFLLGYQEPLILSEFLTQLVASDVVIMLLYYMGMKLYQRETISWRVWLFFSLYVVLFYFGYSLFKNAPYNIDLPLWDSNQMNGECILFGYWGNHDGWHLLAAAALGFMILAIYELDRPLRTLPREQLLKF